MVPYKTNGEEFYTQVREGILVFLFFLCTAVSAYRIIGKLRSRNKDSYDEDCNETLVPRLLCSCGLTFAMVAFLLIPITAILLYILPWISQSYYLHWLDVNLLTSIAKYSFFGTIFSLFGLLPLAYFYTETDLFKGFLSKLYEALSIFILVSALATILVFVMRGMLGLEHRSHSVVLHWWICSTVAVFSCHTIPVGITKVFEWTHTIPLSTKEHREAVEKVSYLESDRNVLQQKLETHQAKLRKHVFDDSKRTCLEGTRTLVNDTTRSIFTVLQELKRELHCLEKTLHEKQHKARSSPFQRNFGFVMAFVVCSLSWLLFICTVSMSLIKGVFAISGKSFTLGISKFEDYKLVETLGEFVLVVYFALALIIGCYQIEPLRRIRPAWGNTCMEHIIANIALLLIIGTTLPTLVPILGLTKLDLIGLYPVTDYTIQNHHWLPFVYRLFVVAGSSYTVLDRYVLSKLIR